MLAQMTHIAEFFGVPQLTTHPQREWVRENQGVILEEDPKKCTPDEGGKSRSNGRNA